MLLKLYNGDDHQIYISPTLLDVANLPDFTGGEIIDVEYSLMTRTAVDAAPWALVNPASYSLSIGLFAAAARTQLAFQNSFADDTGASKKTGTLAFDTAAITTALSTLTGAAASLRCVFEVQIVDATGTDYPYRSKNVSLIKPFIVPGTLTVPPLETALTTSTGVALFVPKDGSNPATPCDQIIIKSRPSGLTKVLWWDDDGNARVENP